MSEKKKGTKETSFEGGMKRLEEIVARLESPETPLEKSMELYREGTKLAAELEERLSKIRLELEEG